MSFFILRWLLILFVLTSSFLQAQIVTGRVPGLVAGKKLLLYTFNGSDLVPLDTCVLYKSGNFVFKQIHKTGFYRISVDSFYFDFIQDQHSKIQIRFKNQELDITENGVNTKDNKALIKLMRLTRETRAKGLGLSSESVEYRQLISDYNKKI